MYERPKLGYLLGSSLPTILHSSMNISLKIPLLIVTWAIIVYILTLSFTLTLNIYPLITLLKDIKINHQNGTLKAILPWYLIVWLPPMMCSSYFLYFMVDKIILQH